MAVVERFAETLGLPCEDFLAAAKKLPTEAVASLSGQVGALRFLRKAAESVLTEHEWERMIRELHELRAGVVAPSDRQHTTSPHKHSQRLHYPNLRGKQVFLAVRDTDMYESLLTIFVQLRASVARYYEVNACLDSLRQKAPNRRWFRFSGQCPGCQ